MAVYEYKALTSDGRNVSGIIDADNPKMARSKLRKQGIFPTDVYEGRGAKGGKTALSLSREVDLKKYFSRVSSRDVSITTRQLATLIAAGVPLIESLTALTDQVENEKLKLVLTQVREKVNEGSSLADAMKAHPSVFNDLFINMVGAGEQSGALDTVLLRLADYSESQVKLRSKVVGALTYPMIMMFVSMVLMGFLFVFVIPKITKIFKDMKIVLPIVTRVLIWLSEFMVGYWWLVIIALVGAVYGFRRYVRSEKGRAVYDRYVLKMPIFGRLLRMVALSRFSNTLSTLLASGVPLLNAMKIVRNIVNNTVIAGAIDQARESIQEGHSIAEPLKRSGEFPPLATHMIAIGERTGQLEPMLLKVSETYETQVDGMVSTMTTLLEPIMIVAMGGMVAFIALSILLPMMQITQSIH
jgi:general secretion pathway protein F